MKKEAKSAAGTCGRLRHRRTDRHRRKSDGAEDAFKNTHIRKNRPNLMQTNTGLQTQIERDTATGTLTNRKMEMIESGGYILTACQPNATLRVQIYVVKTYRYSWISAPQIVSSSINKLRSKSIQSHLQGVYQETQYH